MVPDESVQDGPQILMLGCNRGTLLKFEKAQGQTEWVKTGECRLDQNVTDVLQI